jgi:hypothetical protein
VRSRAPIESGDSQPVTEGSVSEGKRMTPDSIVPVSQHRKRLHAGVRRTSPMISFRRVRVPSRWRGCNHRPPAGPNLSLQRLDARVPARDLELDHACGDRRLQLFYTRSQNVIICQATRRWWEPGRGAEHIRKRCGPMRYVSSKWRQSSIR